MAGDNSLANMSVKEILARWPQTARVFQRFNMACIGCVVAPYCTVAAAARDYDLPLEVFVAALEKVIDE